MKNYCTGVLFAVLLFSFGCAGPNVKYRAEDVMGDNNIPFALMASHVTIAKPTSATQNATAEEKVAAQVGVTKEQHEVSLDELKNAQLIVTSAQAEGTLRYLHPEDGWFAKTNLSIEYYTPFKVPKSVGVVVEDRTVKFIQALGTVVTTVGGIVPLAAPRPVAPKEPPKETIWIPIAIDFTNPEAFHNHDEKECTPLEERNNKYCISYKLTPIEGRKTINRESKNSEEYTWKTFYAYYEDTYTPKIPFSRCVDLELTINKYPAPGTGGAVVATYSTHIADPYHVDWLPLPLKGSITLNPDCDAKTASEKSGNPDAYDIVDAVSKQVGAVWTSLHPSKAGSESGASGGK
jgi:hypothetical protein